MNRIDRLLEQARQLGGVEFPIVGLLTEQTYGDGYVLKVQYWNGRDGSGVREVEKEYKTRKAARDYWNDLLSNYSELRYGDAVLLDMVMRDA